METARYSFEECFDLTVCRARYCLKYDEISHESGHDHVDFIYTDKAEVIALVWIKTFERAFIAWKYVDSMPVLASIEDINKLIRDAAKPKESSFNLWPSGHRKNHKYLLVGGFLNAFKKGYEEIANFTYEGELDPDEFTEWELLKLPQLDVNGYLWVLWQNPDLNSPIKIVVGQVYIDETLVMYRYFKYGIPFMFYLDSEKNKYVQYNFTDSEKKACMTCHSDQAEKYKRHLGTI